MMRGRVQHVGRRVAACLLAVGLGTLASCSRGEDSPGRVLGSSATEGLEVLPIGGDFALTDADGRAFALREHRGEAIVLFFGYTSCPDFCPAAMSKVRRALDTLGDRRARVLTVFISVDPARDTPQAIKTYLANFGLRAAGLTGTEDALQAVARQYAAHFEKEPSASAMGYLVAHTTRLYVIDGQGRVRKLVSHDDSHEVLAAALRRVLDEPASTARKTG